MDSIESGSPREILANAVYERSLYLDELVHDVRFDAFMRDNWRTRRHLLNCGNITMFRDDLPSEIIEAHYFPDILNIEYIHADLTELKSDESENAQWLLDIKYGTNSGAYILQANPRETILMTQSSSGDELRYSFKTEVCATFLLGIICAQTNDAIFLEHIRNQKTGVLNDSLSSGDLGQLLRMIGNLNGTYELLEKSPLLIDNGDRSLLLERKEVETPFESTAGVSVFVAHEALGDPTLYSFNHYEQNGNRTAAIGATTRAELNGTIECLEEIVSFNSTQPTIVDPTSDKDIWQIVVTTIAATLEGYSPR